MRNNYDLTLGRWRWLWVDFPSKEALVPTGKEALVPTAKEALVPTAKEGAAKTGMAEISGFALDFKQTVGFGAALHGESGGNHEHGLAQ
jgi:hypothetical protein